MSIHEIVLPETRPETEWVLGRAVQKVSPVYKHAVLQGVIFSALDAWAHAGHHGRVGSEWRFRIAPPGTIVRPLVPDVAYLSYAVLPADASEDDVSVPLGAPTIAVEIRSSGDRRVILDHKIATYLAAGSAAVFVVDPTTRTIRIHDGEVRELREGDTLVHDALPGFSLDVGSLFARMT